MIILVISVSFSSQDNYPHVMCIIVNDDNYKSQHCERRKKFIINHQKLFVSIMILFFYKQQVEMGTH